MPPAQTSSPTAEIEAACSQLEALIDRARREAQRLEALIAEAGEVRPRDSLSLLEDLAQPAALADPQRLAMAAAALPRARDDMFAENQRQVQISRLAEQGLTANQIAERLSLPIGDVEFLLNLRRS
jgi:DNA-binding NarL/FixJ family response regulator